MPNPESTKFGELHRKLQKAADAAPEFFDLARDVMKRYDLRDALLMHALMDGLREAYEAGRAGRGLPTLRFVQSIADMKKAAEVSDTADAAPEAVEVSNARRSRRPAPSNQTPAVAPVQRVSRRR